MTEPTCSITGCKAAVRVVARRLCTMHYTRWLRTGNAGEASSRRQVNRGRQCAAEGCDEAAAKRGLCRSHYRRVLLAERAQCAVEGCIKPWEQGDFCGMHQYRMRATGEPGAATRILPSYVGQKCAVAGCCRGAQCRNMCKSHYGYVLTTGKPAVLVAVCITCEARIDLRVTKNGRRLANRPRMCEGCLLLRPRGRWCMSAKEIAERDGATCTLCSLPVDITQTWPDPLSPSVDHVIPRSRGGRDVPENVALAHLTCNVSKGIRLTV